MRVCLQEYVARPVAFRAAIEAHREWIEVKLGCSLADSIVIETKLNLSQLAEERILNSRCFEGTDISLIRRLDPYVEVVEIPDDFTPILSVVPAAVPKRSLRDLVGRTALTPIPANLKWLDGPVALRLRDDAFTIVAMNVHFHEGPNSSSESSARLVISRRDCIDKTLRLIHELNQHDQVPRVHTLPSSTREILPCNWNELVLPPEVVYLLKNDFESFFDREAWFREKGLPFRRGYLLHGPPGNGKTTAVRAMLSSRGMSAYTVRLFDRHIDDEDLEAMFEAALRDRPSMVLLEDLDRAFPKTGEAKSNISLQQLLNDLDGVGSGEGIIVVATANEPAILDPAILRRPGRFDRVVCFPNPNAELRREYMHRLNPTLGVRRLERPVSESSGFSFAQLREAFVIAGQRAFERHCDTVSEADLLAGIRMLRESLISGSRRSNYAGFRADLLREAN